MAEAPFTDAPRPAGGPNAGNPQAAQFQARQEFQRSLASFLADEGVVAVVTAGRGDDGTVFTGASGSRDAKTPTKVPGLIFSTEHYGRIARMVEKGVPVTVELDVKNTFYDDNPSSFNIVAEIPGTDPKLKDEVVMLGAHFDSWHTGTGATDNAAGSAVMLEALRLIKATGLKPRRTIRLGLWTGEEAGLARLTRLRERTFRRSADEAAQAADARPLRGLLQRRQRHGCNSRRVSAEEPGGGADLHVVDDGVQRSAACTR